MRETAARFTVELERFLDEEGGALGPLPSVAGDSERLRALYEAMVLARAFDEKAVALQRTGRLGTFASALGQEAVAVGLAGAMREDDVLVPSFREHGAQLLRGVRLEELFAFWGGDERGSDFAGPREDFPVSIPVASHALHAAGVALAMQMRAEPRAAVCVLGDGATSKGDFYEALNVAGAWGLPVVFVVANNGWAISVPRAAQTAAQTLAQKAIAAGIPGCQVDGNDLVAVLHVVGEALARARDGAGPEVVEALTYRLADHTTADDASRYRDDAEVSAHWHGEPVARLRRHLQGRGAWTPGDEERALAESAARVAAAADRYLEAAPDSPLVMFDALHATLPHALEGQREALRAALGVAGDG